MILMTEAFKGRNRRHLTTKWWQAINRRSLYNDSQDELTRPGDDISSLLPAVWVSLQLFVRPRFAKGLVRKTINNYSLPESAVQTIIQLPDDAADHVFD